MITYKPIIIQGGRRKDGTWPVKIRVTFKGKVRRIPTTLVCYDSDLTRSGRIKNATVLERAGELIARMREATANLSPFTLDAWDVDKVVAHIRAALTKETFKLDFISFGRSYADTKKPGTRNIYLAAINALARYLEKDSIDVNDITRPILMDFFSWVEQQPRVFRTRDGYGTRGEATTPHGNVAHHYMALSHIFDKAKEQYNDEDAGVILIPRSPFAGIKRERPHYKGQRSLGVEVMQRIISARPESRQEEVALAAFVVSFCSMGANMADLYEAVPFEGRKWRYFRRKTRDRRADHAEVIVRISPTWEGFVDRLQLDGPDGWWLPALHRWGARHEATTEVNFYLKRWAEREGIEPFTFYAARHTFASLCRQVGVEKATIDEALAHVGDFRIADIYAERNWSLAWDATDKVTALFSWPDQEGG